MAEDFDIDAGELRFRIELQRSTSTKDDKRQPVLSWSRLGDRWASIKPASGQRFVASEQIRDATTHKIVIRFFPGLTPKDRIKYGSRIFNLLSVINEGELGVRHTLLAQEVIA